MSRKLDRHILIRNGWYYLSWREGGQRHSVSMQIPVGEGAAAAENKRKARAWRDQYEEQVLRARGRDPEGLWRELLCKLGELEDQDQLRLRRQWAEELLAGIAAPLPLNKVWQAWVESPLRRKCGERTMEQYEAEYRRFLTWAFSHALATIGEVQERHAILYAADLQAAEYATGSYNAHLRGLGMIWRHLRHHLAGQPNPWDAVPMQRLRRQGRRDLSREELERIVALADGEMRIMIGIGLYTALRLGDCVRLRWDDVDLESGWLSATPHKTAETSGKTVRIPLHPTLLATLVAWRELTPGDRVLPEMWAQYSREASAVAKAVGELFRAAGVETTEDVPAGVTRRKRVARCGFHSLRHSLASLAAVDGPGAMAAVQELLGHGSASTTRLYTHATDAARRRLIDSMPVVG